MVKPIHARLLLWRSEYLHLVAIMQYMLKGYMVVVDQCSCAFTAYFTVYVKGKIEYRCPFWQFYQVAFRGKYKDIVVVELHLEFVDDFGVALRCILKHISQILEP